MSARKMNIAEARDPLTEPFTHTVLGQVEDFVVADLIGVQPYTTYKHPTQGALLVIFFITMNIVVCLNSVQGVCLSWIDTVSLFQGP